MLIHRTRIGHLSVRLVRYSIRQLSEEAHLSPKDSFRETMSSIGSQAMILTAAFTGVPDPSKYHGMTLSSVTSLTVNPEPVIQFNLQVPSTTSSSLHKHKYFALHIMKPDSGSVSLARNFSRGIRVTKDPVTNKVITTRPFEGLEPKEYCLYDNGNKAPLSLNSDHENSFIDDINLNIPILSNQAERIMICEKFKVFRVYNHEIWTAKVKDIVVTVDKSQKTGGLLYFNRQFHEVGDDLKDPEKK